MLFGIMIDKKSRSLPTNQYRRCKSSDDILGNRLYSLDDSLTTKAVEALQNGNDLEGPRVLRRAEKYRLAGKLSDTKRLSKSINGDLFFHPGLGNGVVKGQAKPPPTLSSSNAGHEVRKSSVVFVYSGPAYNSKRYLKQWTERPSEEKESPRQKKHQLGSPKATKKTSLRVKEKVSSILNYTPGLRRRKKGIDHSESLKGREVATMQHTKSLPNVLAEGLRPRSKSIDVWQTQDPDGIWFLSDGFVERKLGRTGTESSDTSQQSESSACKPKVTRSISLGKPKHELILAPDTLDKACSFNDILRNTCKPACVIQPLADHVLEPYDTDDDFSSAGSEPSPYLAHRNGNEVGDKPAHNTTVVMKHSPGTHLNYSDDLSTVVDSRRLPSSIRFQNIRIREIAEEELRIELEGKEFDPKQLTSWSQAISSSVKERVEQATLGQYKIVVQVFIANLADEGFSAAVKCFFCKENDSFIIASYRGNDLFALTSVLAIDFRCEAKVDVHKEHIYLTRSTNQLTSPLRP